MPKPIDMEELLELVSSGAKISTEHKPVDDKKWDSFIGELSRTNALMAAMVEINESKDKERFEEIKDTLEKLVVVLGKKDIDMTPIFSLIKQLQCKKAQAYEFNIERDNRGIKKIIAHPID